MRPDPISPLLVVATFFAGTLTAAPPASPADRLTRDKYGAIIRGDLKVKKLALLFTGDEYGESTEPILDALKQRKIKAGFFVTGKFLRQRPLRALLERAIAQGHYVGPHSDSHPLYAPWDNREKSLVAEEFFSKDLQKNILDLRAIGAIRKGQPIFFIPPYEHYNRDQVDWAKKLGVTLFNFTPGSGSNRDYAKEGDTRFVPSQIIFDDVLAFEKRDSNGLNGFLLLMHLGSGRTDPFRSKLGRLCDKLTERGYDYHRIDDLLAHKSRESGTRVSK